MAVVVVLVVVSNNNWPLETRLPEVGMRQEDGPDNRTLFSLAGAAPARRTQRTVRVLDAIMDAIGYFVACEREIAPGFVEAGERWRERPSRPFVSLVSRFTSPPF